MIKTIARVGMAAAAIVLAGTSFALAETTATPAPNVVAQQGLVQPKASPKPRLTYKVQVRAYDFTRQNASDSTQNGANAAINQQSFNLGIAPHVDYNIWSNLTIGGTYMYANPLNSCVTPYSHTQAACKAVVPKGSLPNGGTLNYDDTLPGTQLNTLYEAYLTWKDPKFYAKIGNQVINTAWAPSSDSRIKPSAFQGGDFVYNLDAHWQVQASDMIRFENRTSSDFSKSTMLTSDPLGNTSQIPSTILANYPGGTTITTPGMYYGRVGYNGNGLVANLHYYGFTDIANAVWLDAKYTLAGVPFKPFMAIQGGDEKNAGTSVIGNIDSQVFGVQGGLNVTKNVLFTVGYNYVPVKDTTLTLPTGYSCSGSSAAIGVKGATQALPYFLPVSGTANCHKNSDGTTTLYYGGWASPYSDSYATDPFFTTSLTQGMVDRRSPGSAYKGQLTFTSTDHHFVTYVSYASYSYNNDAGAEATQETDFDALYYFNHPPAAGQSYKGFLFRYRYGDRDQSGDAYPLPTGYGGTPVFKYNRFQAEYDF